MGHENFGVKSEMLIILIMKMALYEYLYQNVEGYTIKIGHSLDINCFKNETFYEICKTNSMNEAP